MRISLPILVLLCGGSVVALAELRGRAVGTPAPSAPTARAPTDPSAGEIWKRTLAQLEARPTFSADLLQQVHVYGQRLVGSGRYLQGLDLAADPPAPLARIELLLGASGSYQQVCNGKRIWTVSQASGDAELRSIDLATLERALASAERPPADLVRVAFAGCGLTRLLRAIDASVEFVEAAPGTLRGRPVWALRGRWNRDAWIALLPRQREALESGRPPDTRELPEQAPDHFVVYVGRQDLFPYRIDLRRHARPAYLPAGYEAGPRVLFSWELVNVRFDVPLTPAQFAFDPGARSFEDQTARLLAELNLKPALDAAAAAK